MPNCPTCCQQLRDALRVQRAQREARLARVTLAGAALFIVCQWAVIVWLAFFKEGR